MIVGIRSCFSDMLPGGSCAAMPLRGWYTLLGYAYVEAMPLEGLVTILLVGVGGDTVVCRLRPDTAFFEIFSAYAHRAGLSPATTRLYHSETTLLPC